MNSFLKVEGDQFVKDKKNSALLTVNKNVLLQNEARKKLAEKINGKNDEINILKDKVVEITNDIDEIKNMLKMLLQKKD
jgi:septal ring factor EnvC (AmiA/AmiB activator)